MISARTAGAAVTLLLVLGSYWAVYQHGRSVERSGWDVRWAGRDLADSKAVGVAQAETREEEQRRQTVADKEGESARQKLELAEGRATAAESAAGGLRGEIERLRAGRSATCGAIATQQRQARASAVVVLGGLLEESDRMAGDLAAALERSRIAGLACESVVDQIRGG